MIEVRAFRALVYEPDRVGGVGAVGDLSRVLAPPYDVIDEAQRVELERRHPYNVVRLELPRGGSAWGPYDAAARLLREWEAQGVLRRDPQEAMWIHTHEFPLPNGEPGDGSQGGAGGAGDAGGAASEVPRVRLRTGLWAAVRLVEFERRVVLPHEHTLPAPKADRLALLRACRVQCSPVFFVAEDPSGELAALLTGAAAGPPSFAAEFPAGERHRVWRAGRELANRLTELLSETTLLIADGHHRYETALAFRDETRASSRPLPGAEFVLGHIVSERDPGLVLFPTHRVLAGVADLDSARILERAARWFAISELASSDSRAVLAALEAAGRAGRAALALLMPGTGSVILLEARRQAEERVAAPLRGIPVVALHQVFLPEVLGLGEAEQRREGFIGYTRDAEEALRAVREGSAQLACLVLPPRFAQLRAAARAGFRFPPKTTYFAPKVPTGIALRPLDV